MLEPPADLDVSLIRSALEDYWSIRRVELAYASVGHGSHNWIASADDRKWFVKVDRIRPTSHRAAAYRTARQLYDSGLRCVHAPIPDVSGHLGRELGNAWEMAVFRFIDGRNPAFSDPEERARIADVVGLLHAHTPLPETVPRWAPGHLKSELAQLLDTRLDKPWNSGPYAARGLALLLESEPGIRELLHLHDRLSNRLSESDRPWVITHGEPHGGNTMIDETGRVLLIDCDDLMLAPPERDLWLLLHIGHQRPLATDNTRVLEAYRRTGGCATPRPEIIELVRADWHLREISAYATIFGRPHEDSDDLAAHWSTLTSYLPVAQNWSDLG